MSRAARALTPYRHFAITWGLPDDFGGMTAAMLRRSAGFAEAGAPVTVLTFDDRLDTVDAVARLRERGALHTGVAVLHLWDWLAANPLSATSGRPVAAFAPLPRRAGPDPDAGGDIVEIEFDGVVLRRERRAAGELLQVDRYRPDGTLLASDLRDVDERGRPGGRAVTVCGSDGEPVRAWSSMWALYRHWLDRLTDRRRSVLIVDSKTAARFVAGYRRKHVATLHVVHSAHRSGDGEPGRPLKASRREVLSRADSFDAVVALTERQRSDLAADLSPAVHLAVVPNASSPHLFAGAPSARPAGHGLVLASLTTRKRVGHAVAAAALADVALDVYGDGPERDALLRQISELDSRSRLLGHRADAALAFRDASFSLLTSTSEGAPLVLLESMAAGCIPIAYDIRYGPRDVIRDGVDGFLVAPGDIAAMAARIGELVAMPERSRMRMRRAARRAASRYGGERITDRWGTVVAEVAARRWPAPRRAPLPARVRRRLGRLLR